MKIKLTILLFALLMLSLSIHAQSGMTGLPELIMTDIPGATMLGKPMLITGNSNEPLVSQGYGLAAPAFYDWDGDGLKDLLIGEFGSGVEFGRYMGNFVRVYLNTGTEEQPEFHGKFDYARPPFQYKVQAHGTPYSVDQFCCVGFTPQFIDLNNDGYEDMISGLYQGEVMWFRGSAKGFLPGEPLKQEGDPRGEDYLKNQFYWLFSSASFGDLTGDGLADLITGGMSLRISRNIGTKENPQFAKRELIFDINGNPLKVYEYTPDELTEKKKWEELTKNPIPVAGDYHLSPYVVDWDNDGILDLLVTNSYTHSGFAAVIFFRGLKLIGEHRFQSGVPLFTVKNKDKAFPGSELHVFVTDWNNDGVTDLLIGTSIVTVNNNYHDDLSWNWEKDTGIKPVGKDPANLADFPEKTLQTYKEMVKLPVGITMDEYMTIRHKGYVYVMLGSKEENKPVSKKKTKTK